MIDSVFGSVEDKTIAEKLSKLPKYFFSFSLQNQSILYFMFKKYV